MLKTKVFLLQKFVNLQKWLFLAFENLNCCKCLKNKEKSIISDAFCLVVGMAGFEPTTPCPPDKCATRLRYIPNTTLLYIFYFGLQDFLFIFGKYFSMATFPFLGSAIFRDKKITLRVSEGDSDSCP